MFILSIGSSMGWGKSYGRRESFYPPYVSVAEKKLREQKTAQKQLKKGGKLSPVILKGKRIADTFWGKAWCENLERYSDYESRLPQGRAYVRNGSVIDLQIGKGEITAQVSGTSLYKIKIGIKPLPNKKWAAIKTACSGHIGSLIELLQGKFSKNIMEIICRKGEGMFPEPAEIELDCSCPDWADMCKHVAAVLSGVGAHLDEKPELIFLLRDLDHLELVSNAATGVGFAGKTDMKSAGIADDALSDVFGIEIDNGTAGQKIPKDQKSPRKNEAKPASRKKTAKKTSSKKKVRLLKTKKKIKISS